MMMTIFSAVTSLRTRWSWLHNDMASGTRYAVLPCGVVLRVLSSSATSLWKTVLDWWAFDSFTSHRGYFWIWMLSVIKILKSWHRIYKIHICVNCGWGYESGCLRSLTCTFLLNKKKKDLLDITCNNCCAIAFITRERFPWGAKIRESFRALFIS